MYPPHFMHVRHMWVMHVPCLGWLWPGSLVIVHRKHSFMPSPDTSPSWSGVGQLVALDLIYVSGEKSEPQPGELTDLTAQHFIRFEPENPQSTASKRLVIRNAT